MTIDLSEIRKAVAGTVAAAVTAGVTAAGVALNIGPEIIVPVVAGLVGLTGRLIYKIPNDVTL